VPPNPAQSASAADRSLPGEHDAGPERAARPGTSATGSMERWTTTIEPPRGWAFFPLREVWAYRELLYFLVWRDVKLRYKQTALGIVWVALQPIALALMFTIIFSRFLDAPSGGVPYSVFVLAGLVPWQLFAGALGRSSLSLVANEHLLTKIYFPRILIPLASVLTASIDMIFTLAVLGAVLAYYGIGVSATVLILPLLIALVLIAAIGIGLLLAAINVRYRDIQAILPFLTQIWLFATPIAYSVTLVPDNWRAVYDLNPMVGIVEGFRWAIIGGDFPQALWPSAALIILLAVAGIVYFRRAERSFADIV
jgi:lipopolysaccharide transport system permease protein